MIGKSIKDCIEFYSDTYADDKGLTAEDTTYYNSLPLLDYFGSKSVRNITPLEVMKYKKWRRTKFQRKHQRQMSNHTLGSELSLLRTSMNVAVDQGLILLPVDVKHIQALQIKIPKGKPRGAEYIPTIVQAESIIADLPEHLGKIAFAAHRLGYRKKELCLMKFGWIDFSTRLMMLPASASKNGYARTTPLYSEIYDFMVQQRNDARVLFGRDNVNDVHIFRDGKDGINPRNIRYAWNKALVKLRLPNFHFHELRKAAVKYLRMVKNFDRECIRIMYTGHRSKEIFDKIYDCVTAEDTQHWISQVLAN